MTDQRPEKIGKYDVLAKLGQGAMGEVWRARDPILNRDVAIKTMVVGEGGDETLRTRFHREGQSAAHLNHPNIITVYELGDERGRLFMAMELLEGRDLKDLIANNALGDVVAKLDVMEQICDGLAYAHARGVVHRDLKPGNIHVQPGGQVKIMDFGLARLGSSDVTKSGTVLGTPNYMSPEQVRGERADARSDVFSLGAVFYELLTSHKPFEADSLHAVLYKVLQNEPDSVRTWAPDVPAALIEVVERALSKEAADRFQDAAEMREALRAARAALAQTWTGEATMVMPATGEPKPAPRSRIGSGARALQTSGTAALDPGTAARLRSGSGAREQRTLSGRAPTRPGSPAAAPEAPPSRARWALWAGGAAALALLGGGVALLRPTPPADAGSGRAGVPQPAVEGPRALPPEGTAAREGEGRAPGAPSEPSHGAAPTEADAAAPAPTSAPARDAAAPGAGSSRGGAAAVPRAASRADASGPQGVASAAPSAPPAASLPPPTVAVAPSLLPPPTLAPTPAPPPVTAAAPAPAAPPATAAPAPPVLVDDDAAIRKLVADYARAIETQDLALFRALKPNLTPEEEKRLHEAFAGIRSQRVEMRILAVEVRGQTSTVRVSRRDQINGKAVSPVEQAFVLVKGPAGWTIREIGR